MEIFLFCKKKIGKSAKIAQEHRASSLFRHSPTRLCSKCKTVSSFSRPVPAIFSANSPPAAHTRISVKRLIVCHSATWFFLTTRPMPATRLKSPNGLLKEPLWEARPGRFVSSFRPFGRAGVALSPGQLAFSLPPSAFSAFPTHLSAPVSRFPPPSFCQINTAYGRETK